MVRLHTHCVARPVLNLGLSCSPQGAENTGVKAHIQTISLPIKDMSAHYQKLTFSQCLPLSME